MTEEQARQLCRELDAVFAIRKRHKKANLYLYVSRWLPRRAAEAAGYKVSKSTGQQFDRYVCPMNRLAELDEATLRARIAELPINPNKLPTGQALDRSTPQLARWHAQTQTPTPEQEEPHPHKKQPKPKGA